MPALRSQCICRLPYADDGLGGSQTLPSSAVIDFRAAAVALRGSSNQCLPAITRTSIVRVMAHITAGVEYGLHCLLWLTSSPGAPLSSRDLADFQGISPSFVAKVFPKLEKAGIVTASEGIKGGYLLAKQPQDITVLDVVDAIEGRKPLFDCQEIRSRCAVYRERPPSWATKGVCAIHAVMLRAEKAMRDSLASQTLADIAGDLARKAPPAFSDDVRKWLVDRARTRTRGPAAEDGALP